MRSDAVISKHRRAALALASCWLVLTSGGAFAWEADLHYGLTEWLARKAGAGSETAIALAEADQALDVGALSAVNTVLHYACFGRDAGRSREVRDDHFPSFAEIPGAPAARTVLHASAAAQRRVKDRLANPGSDDRYETEAFGNALHALQDSWAHEGVPDIPTLMACSEELAWGHPVTRHGWSRHDADITSMWPPSTTLETAKSTYEAILLFLGKHRELRNAPPALWKSLGRDIEAFAQAKTKAAKREWFVQQGISRTLFLLETSLPDGRDAFEQRKRTRLPSEPPGGARTIFDKPSRETARFYTDFFRDWATSYDFTMVASRYIDVGRTAAMLDGRAKAHGATGHAPAGALPRDEPMHLVADTLRMWRLRDHGKVAAIDHQAHPSEGQRELFSLVMKDDAELARYSGFLEAYEPLSRDPEFPFAVMAQALEGRSRFVALARFAHAPNDTLGVVAEAIDGRMRVVDIVWVIDP